jgi:hypothetical protein
MFLASLIPIPSWITPEISDRIVNVVTIAFFGVSWLLIMFFIYLMMTDPVVDGKLFPRVRVRKDKEERSE